jgi:DNA polymerase-1
MPMAKPNRLLIVDGHAYAYRAFYAIRELSSPDGAPTNAIYGFIKMLGKLQLQLVPSHAVVVWDGGLSAERTVELPGYKAQRPPMPESLGRQIDQIGDYLAAAGVTSVRQEGVEADDWIAAFAGKASGELPAVVASSDKDFMQLVSPHVGLANPSDKSDKVWTTEDVVSKSGVLPGQIVDWLSLIGDSVDNIPGVPGVGPKTATDLLKQFGTIESVYARLDEVKSDRLRASLAAAREVVLMNQRLIRLQPAELPVNLDAAEIRPPRLERLRELYAGWGFKTMLAQLGGAPLTQGALL